MELQELYDKLIAEGCNNFYIEGIGIGNRSSDVYALGLNNGSWQMYYTERGIKAPPMFSTSDKAEAIEKYYDYITRHIEHWHIVVFSRHSEILEKYKRTLADHQMRTIQNDIDSYSFRGDIVYRLFVVGKDIFKARELFEPVPYWDEDLRR